MSNSKYRVNECIFMLDCGRKYFTPDWIKRLIDEISAVGYNAINIHFAEPPANPGNVITAPNEKVKGAGFCLWTDTPAAESEDEILEHIRPYFTAIAQKASGKC